MKLTSREKFMVTLLLFCFAAYFIFTYVVTPQRAHLQVLKADLATWQEKKQALDKIDETMAQYGQQQADLNGQLEAIGNNYFSSLSEEEETIIVLNDLLRDAQLKDVSITFTPLSTASVGGAAAGGTAAPQANNAPLVQKVQLSYSGTYDALWNALGSFWNFQKCIQVDSITISPGEGGTGLVTGEMSLSFYDLSPITGKSKNMVIWSDNGQFRRTNPFLSTTGETFIGTRYILDLSDSAMKLYEKFTDIGGNWAETAIDDFGKRYLITGDAENKYHPDDPMTRGDFVILLDSYYQWDAPVDAVDLTIFSDYAELGSSLSAMEKGFYKGYMMGYFIGYDDGTLRPNSPTLYKEFNLVMGKILNQPNFNWRDAALKIQQETGYTSPGLVDENAPISKAEVVYFLHSLSQE